MSGDQGTHVVRGRLMDKRENLLKERVSLDYLRSVFSLLPSIPP